MFYIDDKKLILTKQEIYVGKFTNNNIKGYNLCIHLIFVNKDNGETGYLYLNAGFDKNGDINNFFNKEYCGVPFENDNQFIYFEVFDTEKFLDTEIESPIVIKLNGRKDNGVEAFFEVNDDLIKIKFNDYLDIDNKLFEVFG